MTIVALDDEELLLWRLERELKKVFPGDSVMSFDDGAELLDYAAGENVDFAFLDIQLTDGSGIELAQKLREINPQIRIVFCTASPEYTMDAFRVYANGYLLKPIKAEEIQKLLVTIAPPSESKASRVEIHTFGNFDVFIDGRLIVFTKSKAKELLAYLVDRKGSCVSSAEIGAVLWDDQADSSTLKDRVQHVKKALRDTLRRYGAENILISSWNALAIDKTQVSCDYYNMLNGDPTALQGYLGEYMTNYSWAEDTAGAISYSVQN